MNIFYRAGMQLAPTLKLVGMVEEQDIKLFLDVDEAGIPSSSNPMEAIITGQKDKCFCISVFVW